jgi:SOS-response transcriptional repressor LexA
MTSQVQFGITPRQHAVLTFVRGFISERGYSPSVTEIAAAFSCSAPNITRMLGVMEKRGAVVRSERHTRSIMPASAA